ncbi:3-isopropylmalate dehydrogenase [Azohydromonas lata]|uniref:3-isopropylmalate dehydrogenase n=1 Tax=Azohydromonas lata TaxID=45677 RepID=A0ABU5ID39_9BURK|nr:3-isopropylmalate dehydrogenase [Azohydromonas lata]MDZ5455883.1 3-isopropylmalate dehydrogenase [Azohydromonas lata]
MSTLVSQPHRIAVLPGEGIGPEIVAQALKVLRALQGPGIEFEINEAPVGGSAYLLTGTPLPQPTVELALASDAVLFGAVGDPCFDHLETALRPERAILGLRNALGLFANLKQVSVPAELAELSPLRADKVSGVDVLVVRELNGDVYTGQPRGVRVAPDGLFTGEREGFDTMRYAEGEVRRIAHVAFKAAQRRSKRVCNVDKANVLATSRVWREVVIDVAREYPDIELTHLYADSAAMQLISNPGRFDVILAGNLFGDILSDAASVLTGSIGLPASALLGEGPRGMYEAGHGTALDIAGRDIANPLACIRAAALMLRHSLGRNDLAQRIEAAVTSVLRQGLRTADLAGGSRVVGTSAMGDAVVAALR